MNPRTYPSKAEIEALFRVIKSPRDRALFRLVYHHGLRSSEIGLLQLSDWNDQDGILKVHRQKNSINQCYRLLPVEANALRAWIRGRGDDSGPLFSSRKGARPGGLGIDRTQVFRLIAGYSEAAGLPSEKAQTRALRHACGVHLRADGCSAEVIRKRLGHRAERSVLVYFRGGAGAGPGNSKIRIPRRVVASTVPAPVPGNSSSRYTH